MFFGWILISRVGNGQVDFAIDRVYCIGGREQTSSEFARPIGKHQVAAGVLYCIRGGEGYCPGQCDELNFL